MTNLCEEVRNSLVALVAEKGSVKFTNRELGLYMGLITNSSSEKEQEKINSKIGLELNRCRAINDNWEKDNDSKKKVPQEKSDHAYMLKQSGIRLSCCDYSNKHSKNNRRPARQWLVESLNQTVTKEVIKPQSNMIEMFLQQVTDEQLVNEFTRRFNEAAA